MPFRSKLKYDRADFNFLGTCDSHPANFLHSRHEHVQIMHCDKVHLSLIIASFPISLIAHIFFLWYDLAYNKSIGQGNSKGHRYYFRREINIIPPYQNICRHLTFLKLWSFAILKKVFKMFLNKMNGQSCKIVDNNKYFDMEIVLRSLTSRDNF